MPKMRLPPGVTYILENVRLPRLLSYALSLLVIQYIISSFLDSQVSLLLLLSISVPLFILLHGPITHRINQYKAARVGAVLPPKVNDPWPLGFGILSSRKQFQTQYLGNLFHHHLAHAAMTLNVGAFLQRWISQYGLTINFTVFFETRTITAQPEHVKAMLATQFENFEKGPKFRSQFFSLLGNGVFNTDGEMWKFHRSLARNYFTRDRISHFDIFEKHSNTALQLMNQRFGDGGSLDFQEVASKFTLDSASEFLFGHNIDSLHNSPLAHSNEALKENTIDIFSASFMEVQTLTAKRSRYGPAWPLFEFWRDRVEAQMTVVKSFVEPIVKSAVERRDQVAQGDVEQEQETLLDHLVRMTDDWALIRDETFNILIAGRDTTANTITWSMYRLIEHPAIREKLYEEIIQQLGSRVPTFEDMKNLKYLRAFINEVLRLYPAVPFNVRYAIKDTVLPATAGSPPYYIPAHTRVVYNILEMHRRPEFWGPTSELFDPERWLDGRMQKYLLPNPFIFLPFNAGPRICLGQQFAYHEVSYFLIRLLQTFPFTPFIELDVEAQRRKFHPPPGGSRDGQEEKVWPSAELTMSARGGCWVKMS